MITELLKGSNNGVLPDISDTPGMTFQHPRLAHDYFFFWASYIMQLPWTAMKRFRITNIALCASIVQTRTILPDFQIGTIISNRKRALRASTRATHAHV